MLYGADYHSAAERNDGRLLRRFRRDVMFLAARPQEVVAAGVVAGLAVLPLVLVGSILLTALFYAVFSGGPAAAGPAGGGLTEQPAPTSHGDILVVLVLAALTLGAAGAAGAALRRYDYRRQGGFRYYLHHPRSPLGLAGFFAPVTALVIAGLLRVALGQPRGGRPDMLVGAPSLLDRGVFYLFLGLTLSMLLYMVWEACFPAILPTLSDLDIDAEIARLQHDDAARIRAEEDRVRGIGPAAGPHP